MIELRCLSRKGNDMAYEKIVGLDLEIDPSMQSKTYLNRTLKEKADRFAEVFVNCGFFNDRYQGVLNTAEIEPIENNPYFENADKLDENVVIAILSSLVDSHKHNGWTLMNSIRNGSIDDLLGRLEEIDYETRELPAWIDEASRKALDALRDFPQDEETTPYLAIKPFLQHIGKDGKTHERGLSTSDEFDIVTALERHAPEFGLYLDSSAYDNMLIGLPINIPFSVRKIPVGETEPVFFFTFGCGEFFGCYSALSIRGFLDCTVAIYNPSGLDSERRIITVSEKQLEGLHRVFNEIDLSNWGSYSAPVLDGIQWSLVLQENGHRYESGGSNAFPKGFDKLISYLIEAFGCKDLEVDGGYEAMFPEYSNPVSH